MEYPVVCYFRSNSSLFGTARAIPSCFRILSEHAAAFYTAGGTGAFTHFLPCSYQSSHIERTLDYSGSTRLYQQLLPVYLYDAYGRSPVYYGLLFCLAFLVDYESAITAFPSQDFVAPLRLAAGVWLHTRNG